MGHDSGVLKKINVITRSPLVDIELFAHVRDDGCGHDSFENYLLRVSPRTLLAQNFTTHANLFNNAYIKILHCLRFCQMSIKKCLIKNLNFLIE